MPLPIHQLRCRLGALRHGNHRSGGVAGLHEDFAGSLSRRELNAVIARQRDRHKRRRRRALLRLTWHQPNLAWAIDATLLRTSPDDPGIRGVLVRDLASHFHFEPLLLEAESAEANLRWLHRLVDCHGPPLFLKRDNGSPFNTEEIDAFLASRGILPLNSPVRCPRYNGAIEHGIGSFKADFIELLDPEIPIDAQPLVPRLVHAVTHLRNASERRSLAGLTPAIAYHHVPRFAPTAAQRRQTFEWISARVEDTLGTPWETSDHHARAAAWRRAVAAWLRCQGLITVSRKPKPSPLFVALKRS